VVTRFTKPQDLPQFLTPHEFGAFYGLGRSTVYDLLQRGEIPCKRLGRCIRIPRNAVVEWGQK